MSSDLQPLSSPTSVKVASSVGQSDQLDVDEAYNFFDFEAWNGEPCDTTRSAVDLRIIPDFSNYATQTLEAQSAIGHATQEQCLGWSPWSGPELSHHTDEQFSDAVQFKDSSYHPDLMQEWSHNMTLDSLADLEKNVDEHGCEAEQYQSKTQLGDGCDLVTARLHFNDDNMQPSNDITTLEQSLGPPTPHLVSKSKRTRITKAAKKILNDHFLINPYPNDAETSTLSRTTQLTGRTIKTWFSNSRSRKKLANDEDKRSPQRDLTRNHSASGQSASPAQSLCRASLEALDRVSPTPSLAALERYLALPASEEAIMPELFNNEARNITQPQRRRLSFTMLGLSTHEKRPRRALSVANSAGSRGSAHSRTSQNSFRSVDSRGSRRGRKLWKRTERQKMVLPPVPHKEALEPYFCTWPSCSARFGARWEWVRHEEAIHYQPYHWICCLESTEHDALPQCFVCGERNITIGHIMAQHCTPCKDKDREQRVFLREDQLFQHIRGVHLHPDVSKKVCQEVLSAWKIDNPFINSAAMTCGFCGERLYAWSERSEHVSAHLKSKKCRASWWPERLSIVETRGGPLHMDEPFDCYNCGWQFKDIRVAARIHSSCVSWSCRNLTDWHAIFDEIPSSSYKSGMLSFACKLCGFTTGAYEKDYDACFLELEAHAEEKHFLRQCSQGRFAVLHDFLNHMTLEHGAHTTLDWDALSSWKCRQNLKWSATRSMIGTIFHPPVTGLLCDSYGDTQDSTQFEIPLYPV